MLSGLGISETKVPNSGAPIYQTSTAIAVPTPFFIARRELVVERLSTKMRTNNGKVTTRARCVASNSVVADLCLCNEVVVVDGERGLCFVDERVDALLEECLV